MHWPWYQCLLYLNILDLSNVSGIWSWNLSSTFSCGILNVIFCESANVSRNSKVDIWSNIGFWMLIKNPKVWSRNINVSWAIRSSCQEATIKSIWPRYIIILIQSFCSKVVGFFISLLKTFDADEFPKRKHRNSYDKPFHWNLTY